MAAVRGAGAVARALPSELLPGAKPPLFGYLETNSSRRVEGLAVLLPWRVLLLIFGFFRHVGAACTSCWGAAASDGCTGDATTCPWVIAVAANSATIGAMASGRLVVDKLLPKKILRLFSYRVLKIISMLYSVRAGEGTAANTLEEYPFSQLCGSVDLYQDYTGRGH